MLWLNPYERVARLAPGLLAIFSIAVTITALGLRNAPVISVIVSLASLAGGPLLLSGLVRSKGLKAQDTLWIEWGGTPSTQLLRMRTDTNNGHQRATWRSSIQKVTGVHLLSEHQEIADPTKADETIEVAVGKLRELTRGKEFALLSSENRNYGFERNFYGIRAFARIISVISVAVLLASILWRHTSHIQPAIPSSYILGEIADLLILICWLVLPSKTRTKSMANKYAYQLLQAGSTLGSS